MPKFILEINLGNEGMKEDIDIAGALERCAAFIRTDGLWDSSIRDINGNTVGHYEVSP